MNLPYKLILPGQNKYNSFEGEKLRGTVENNGTVIKVFVCETVSGIGSLKFIVTPGGRAVKSGRMKSFLISLIASVAIFFYQMLNYYF